MYLCWHELFRVLIDCIDSPWVTTFKTLHLVIDSSSSLRDDHADCSSIKESSFDGYFQAFGYDYDKTEYTQYIFKIFHLIKSASNLVEQKISFSDAQNIQLFLLECVDMTD